MCHGIHLMVIDLFPPGKRDPYGIHKAIWDQFEEAELELPADKILNLASYDAGPAYVAYVKIRRRGRRVATDAPLLEPGGIRPDPAGTNLSSGLERVSESPQGVARVPSVNASEPPLNLPSADRIPA
jgi:hypothetical protein